MMKSGLEKRLLKFLKVRSDILIYFINGKIFALLKNSVTKRTMFVVQGLS